MNNFKTYSFIILSSLFVFLYLAELYLTLFLYNGGEGRSDPELKEKKLIYKKLTGKEYDIRKKINVYKDYLIDEKNTSIALHAYHASKSNSFYLSGVSKSNTINCNENGYFSKYFSDRYGFNNPDKEWDQNEITYLLVGDSHVHGACVNRPDDISSVLRKISGQPVINLGFNGNGPLTAYASLREYMPKNVKNILWFFYEGNDIIDLRSETTKPTLTKYINDKNFSKDLRFNQKKVDRFQKNIIKETIKQREELEIYWSKYYSKKKKFLRFLRLNQSKNFLATFQKQSKREDNFTFDLNKFKETLLAAKQLAQQNGSNFYFVCLGTYSRYKSPHFNINPYIKNYPRIIKIVNDLGIRIIDINKDSFLKDQDPLKYFPFRERGHYNVEGYKKITELIYHKIRIIEASK